MQLFGNGKDVVDMLKNLGLGEYESKIYFTLLTLGEAKVTAIIRRASIPQSKAYVVLDSLRMKGFVELSSNERPKKFRARALKEVTIEAIAREEKRIRGLYNTYERLDSILQAITPTHNKYSWLRLFSPKYKRR